MTRLAALIIFLALAPDLFGGNAEPVQQVDDHGDCSELCAHGDRCSKHSGGVDDC